MGALGGEGVRCDHVAMETGYMADRPGRKAGGRSRPVLPIIQFSTVAD